MLIEIQGYQYRLSVFEATVKRLTNELEEKDKEMKSLRTQRDQLYKALQEKIQLKAAQSFASGFDELTYNQVVETKEMQKAATNQNQPFYFENYIEEHE